MLAGLVCIFCWRIGPLQLTAEAQLENFRVMTEDGFLHARWDAVAATNLNEICVTVTDDGGNVLAKENCGAQATSFQFRTGEHGEPYTVSVCMVLTDGTRTQSVSDRKLFLRYNRMPDIPFFVCGPTMEPILPFDW